MGVWAGILGGVVDRRREIEAENIRRAELAAQRETDVLKLLLTSPRQDVRSMALTGLIQGSEPPKRKRGIQGWFGEMERNPIFPQVLQYMQTPQLLGYDEYDVPVGPQPGPDAQQPQAPPQPGTPQAQLPPGTPTPGAPAALPATSPTEAGAPPPTPQVPAGAPPPPPTAFAAQPAADPAVEAGTRMSQWYQNLYGGNDGPPPVHPAYANLGYAYPSPQAGQAPAQGQASTVEMTQRPDGTFVPAQAAQGQPMFQASVEQALPGQPVAQPMAPPAPPPSPPPPTYRTERRPVYGRPDIIPSPEEQRFNLQRGTIGGELQGEFERYKEVFRQMLPPGPNRELEATRRAAELFITTRQQRAGANPFQSVQGVTVDPDGTRRQTFATYDRTSGRYIDISGTPLSNFEPRSTGTLGTSFEAAAIEFGYQRGSMVPQADFQRVYDRSLQIDEERARARQQAPTAIQRRILGFYNRGKLANDLITQSDGSGSSIENRITQQGILSQAQGALAPNLLQTTDQQQYTAAQRAFTEARLRQESGAAVPPFEYENDRRTYFFSVGDTPDTMALKVRGRMQVLDGLGVQAGSAYSDYYGQPYLPTTPAGTSGGVVGPPPAGPAQPPPANPNAPPATANPATANPAANPAAETPPPTGLWTSPSGRTYFNGRLLP